MLQAAERRTVNVLEIIVGPEADVLQPCEQLFERDLSFQPRQRRAHAEMDALAEGDVRGRVGALDVELFRVRKVRLLAIGRLEADADVRAGRQGDAFHLVVLGHPFRDPLRR